MHTFPNAYLRKWEVWARNAQVWYAHPASSAAMTPVAKEGELKDSVGSAPETLSKMLTASGKALQKTATTSSLAV